MFDVNMFDGEGDLRDFKDICICALRYALPRHTYAVDEVCSFIEKYASVIIDNRTYDVIMRDIEEVLNDYYSDIEYKARFNVDVSRIEKLKEFLIEYDKTKLR